ncbi:glycosyl transferase family 2 [Solidesulfovibrio fructosivorans JJ]]|uniref:Glycosyl transferase family 2 n=1 Tax=Solidesulfovibrio fructosivorans JJ] TaxID=596151 RepID=E1K0M4_SOLFR|nr:glycosyltransferase [Solidesulfovibrio fructosivorans]EFL49876.1 glycosyl transferase family 2 [Solidesulfovibrio fructosivorans JJ]]
MRTGQEPFARLPETVRRLLLVGGRGPGLAAARDAAMAAGDGCALLADALALAVWRDAPLWPEAAAVLAARDAARAFLPPETAVLAAHVAAYAGKSVPEPYFERLAARRETAKMLAYLLTRQGKAPEDPGLAHRIACLAPMVGDFDGAIARMAALPEPLAPLGRQVAGELALFAGRAGEAAALLRRALPTPAVDKRLAEALFAGGDREGGLAALSRAVSARPFDALGLARLHDLAAGFDWRTDSLPGSVAVLVYSFNNARLLDRTLDALSRTDWTFAAGGARLTVLDNGSGDDTAALLSGWRERMAGRMDVVALPVNIGAPAARNWLAALPGTRSADFAVFFDDDALPPPDWLGRFGAAVAAQPGAGVWGAMIRGIGSPHFVQSADTHLIPTPRLQGEWGRGFDLARPWLATADDGAYGVCRPCASVTGCCHLFRAPVLADLGGFDLRFSPTQYDDLDMDLRQLLAGRPAVCQGHLRVVHAKATGAASGQGGKQYGSGFANQFKLHHKYDDGQFAAAAETAFAALAADCAAKAEILTGMGRIAPETAALWRVAEGGRVG